MKFKLLSILIVAGVGCLAATLSAQPPSENAANAAAGLNRDFSVPSDIGAFDHYACDVTRLAGDATTAQMRSFLMYQKAIGEIYISIPRDWLLEILEKSNYKNKKLLQYSLYSLHADPSRPAGYAPNVMNISRTGNGHFGTDTTFRWIDGVEGMAKFTLVQDDTGTHAVLQKYRPISDLARNKDFEKEPFLALYGECSHSNDYTNYDEGLKGVLEK